jgi:GH15 family glucan-1,4-alpha-glucosidase
MFTGIECRGLALVLTAFAATVCLAQPKEQKRPWKGYSILGNGHVVAVYSDDTRITSVTHAKGIQHLYFKDYTADYVASTSFELVDSNENTGVPEIGMKNFFTAQTLTPLADGSSKSVLCFVHPRDAVVISLGVSRASASNPYRFEAQLRKEIKTDTTLTLTSFAKEGQVAIAVWSNGTVLAIAPKASEDKVIVSGSSVVVTGKLTGNSRAEVWLVPASSEVEALSKVRALQRDQNLETSATKHWEFWMNHGILPKFLSNTPEAAAYLEAYKRNVYCVKAATLNGQIPADITGQFVTNNMPQLYPRDAMMCARVLLMTGHAQEARQVIEFWANPRIPMKTPGEWYARYDAHGQPVDSGSGARFDEPEWDANGYFIYLVTKYHESQGVWLADRKLIYQLADFLVHHVGENGLLEEGGIVEWTGYLPATNMICSAALQTAAKLAHQFGEEAKAATYTAASQKIAAALPQMFDQSRQTYADVRFTGKKGPNGESLAGQSGEKAYLWDTTANVGVIWGYPSHREIELSNLFYAKTTVKLGGGMQYFDTTDPGLAEYGHAVFLFTTAAASQYQSLHGNRAAAKSFIDWMLRNANSYGLMPERIFLDDSDCSPASPLSWCSAEFAAALLLWSRL